jgi:hypothetical protein
VPLYASFNSIQELYMAKRQIDYTVSDIIRETPAWFVKKQANGADPKPKLAYIHRILDSGPIEVMGYSFLRVFESFDVSGLTNADINKLVFSARTRVATEVAKKRSVFEVIGRQNVAKLAVHSNKAYIDQQRDSKKLLLKEAQRRVNNIRAELEAKQERMIEVLREKAEAEQELFMIDQIPEIMGLNKKFVTQLQRISDLWQPFFFSDHTLYLVRRFPVHIVDSNTASGDAMGLNMGTPAAAITLKDGSSSVIVDFAFDRIVVPGNSAQHPHVAGIGNVCLGNASERAMAALSKRDIEEVIVLLEGVLTTYGAAPYVEIERFYAKRNTGRAALNLPGWLENKQGAVVALHAAVCPEYQQRIEVAYPLLFAKKTPHVYVAMPAPLRNFFRAVRRHTSEELSEAFVEFLEREPQTEADGISTRPNVYNWLDTQYGIRLPQLDEWRAVTSQAVRDAFGEARLRSLFYGIMLWYYRHPVEFIDHTLYGYSNRRAGCEATTKITVSGSEFHYDSLSYSDEVVAPSNYETETNKFLELGDVVLDKMRHDPSRLPESEVAMLETITRAFPHFVLRYQTTVNQRYVDIAKVENRASIDAAVALLGRENIAPLPHITAASDEQTDPVLTDIPF